MAGGFPFALFSAAVCPRRKKSDQITVFRHRQPVVEYEPRLGIKPGLRTRRFPGCMSNSNFSARGSVNFDQRIF
ncbi:MAG: hypothetical protein EBT80_00585 [Chitinophagales bacterium]|nr:hypothetical protein [Chitinophagales bacterium]